MSLFKQDSFVRWSSKDEEGSFSIVGQVISCDKTGIMFYSAGHEYFIPRGDGKIANARKPKDWDAIEESRINDAIQRDIARKNKPAPVEKPKVKRTTSSTPKTGTKKDRAKKIYQEEIHRTDIIKRFREELDMTQAGANTYYLNFKSNRW